MEEDKTYAELVAADEEVKKIMADIDQVIKSAASREFGEKFVLKVYAPLLDEAMRKSREALDKWLREGRDLIKETEALLREKP